MAKPVFTEVVVEELQVTVQHEFAQVDIKGRLQGPAGIGSGIEIYRAKWLL